MKNLAIFVFCAAAAGQHQHSAANADKPVTLLAGLGIWSHPIHTRSAEAQKFFDQGLVLLYGFNRPEALRSFHKVMELDPGAAMAQWGIAMARGPYLNMDMDPDIDLKQSCEAAQAGVKAPDATADDRAWLSAAAARCPDYADPARYVEAMRALATRYPDDPDAQTFFAESLLLPVRWRWYSGEGTPAAGVEEAERVLEGVLRRFPDHPGANHLYIHAVESSRTPERAIPSAQRLMGVAPAAGHIVHMPGHIWLALGDYRTAVDVNERAAQVDRQYFAKTGAMSSYYAYYLHNLQFIVYAHSMQGHAADTRKAVAEILQAGSSMPEMADVVTVVAAMTQIRIADWDALLRTPRPASPLAECFWRFARAMALAGKGDRTAAAEEQKPFAEAGGKLDRNMQWSTNKLGGIVDLASSVLSARLQTSPAAASAEWRKAVEIQDGLAYDEPPSWYYPVRESLGASLLLSGDAAAAEAVFREGLRRSPRNGRMLFGLLESLKAQKKTDAAAWVEREFRSVWKGADTELRLRDL